jgi:hypothetical protein
VGHGLGLVELFECEGYTGRVSTLVLYTLVEESYASPELAD